MRVWVRVQVCVDVCVFAWTTRVCSGAARMPHDCTHCALWQGYQVERKDRQLLCPCARPDSCSLVLAGADAAAVVWSSPS